MPYDRFLIAPINTGLQTDLKPWLIPDDSFAQLNNAYVFRGRVKKRFGSRYTGTGWASAFDQPLYSRLRVNIGTTDAGTGNLSVTVPGSFFGIGQQFSVGTQVFTVTVTGTPAALLASTGTGTATFNTTTGALVITGAALNTIAYYYTGQPVMGFTQFETLGVNNAPAIAFDPQFAYIFSGGSWIKFGPSAGNQWHGDDTNFFWSANYRGVTDEDFALFVTNFQAALGAPAPATDDPIWYYNGSIWNQYANATTTDGYTALRSDESYLLTSRIILPFKDRLVALNTIEYDATANENQQFVNRCRYSINGSPFARNTTTVGMDVANAPYAWLEPNQSLSVTVGAATATTTGQGAGYIDAATDEEIVSAEFIKDRLIVYFERSTWELVYTGNQIQPFVWQKINTELGADATFSVVPFDKAVLAIGNVGVHACNGSNVERVDSKIPDQVFQINKRNEGVKRVAGIRDYFSEMVYWTFPTGNASKYPNRILVFNYQNSAWAFNDDCITAWGYFEQQDDITWSSTTLTWEQFDASWTSGVVQANFRQVIAGNQQGYVFIVDSGEGAVSRNAAAMSVTNMVQTNATTITLTIIDHTLVPLEYISVENLQGVTLDKVIYQVNGTPTVNTITIKGTLTGTYAGGAVVSRVSNIGILSKQWNPYIGQGRNFYLPKIDFCVDRTQNGEVTVDYFPSGSNQSMLEMGNGGTVGTQSNIGNGVLETRPYDPAIYPFEQVQDRLWHPVYFQTDGQTIQIFIYMSPEQITDPSIAWSDFVLEGLCLHTMPTSMRLQ
jgi:hypothetical protein